MNPHGKTILFIILVIATPLSILQAPPAHAQPTGPTFGVAAGFGDLAGDTLAHQSLLRLANTTGQDFFIANGDLANGYYYGHEVDWCNEFHAHYPNLMIVAGTHDTGHDFIASYQVYDANNDGVYDSGDTILFKGSGTPPVLGSSSLNSQVRVEYVDVGLNGHWVLGDPVLYDEHGVGVVEPQMPLLNGTMPALGTMLSLDPNLKFYDSTGSGFNDPPSGNQNFEAFTAAAGCNTAPPSITGYHYSGIDCSPHLPGELGYVFPTCYGREYYFDCCKPVPQIRVIVIAAGMQNITGLGAGYNVNTWNFQTGDPHYNWLNSVIQDGKGAGLLTMVVSADVCASLGAEECGEGFHSVSPIDSTHAQYGLDLVDLLANGNVDFWVSGSDYGYERQKQMTSVGCPFTATGYKYDGSSVYANLDTCNHVSTGFSGNIYRQGAGYAGVTSAAFGMPIRWYNETGEPIVQDLNGDNVYDTGDPVLAWPPPATGNPLTSITGAPNYIMFNDVHNNGIYDPSVDTLYFDANNNGRWDPGETILEGPYNVWAYPQNPVSASQFKVIDWNGNGQWDQSVNGSLTNPHHSLTGRGPNGYYSAFMGKNTPCNTATCPGHGWLQYSIGSTVTAATHFCRDGEHPTSNYSQCMNPTVYSDSFSLSLSGRKSGLNWVSVITGPGGQLYSSSFNGSWTGWSSIAGTTASPPALCGSGTGRVDLVLRGVDNGIYHKTFSAGVWSSGWDSLGGKTVDQPACAILNGLLYVVVRGTGNFVYWNSMQLITGQWSRWQSLAGYASSAPVLVATPSASRLDLLIRGLNDEIYHMAFLPPGSWSGQWDSPSGLTIDVPAAVSDGTLLHVVVRGSDNVSYYNSLSMSTGAWKGWQSLVGQTRSAPVMISDSAGAIHLVLRGMNNRIYDKIFQSGVWSSQWDSPGGSTLSQPAVAVLGSGLAVVVEGSDNAAYYNTLEGGIWSGWSGLGGAVDQPPAIATT